MHIVQNSIYGVDIEKGAVDIARLRFWLSIVVDAVKPEPLPNLDYKIMQGNSLIESYRNTDLSHLLTTVTDCLFDADTDQIVSLQKAIQGYYLPHDNKAKEKIQEEIKEKVIAIVKERLPDPKVISDLEQIDLHANQKFFLWHTWFCDVFNRPSKDGSAGGFDIVIGNPPYVKEKTNKNAFNGLKGTTYYKGKMDLWFYFVCVGLDLSKQRGVLSFIAQNQWYTSDGASIMREKIRKEGTVLRVNDFNSYMVFNDASTQTMIFFIKKNASKNDYQFTFRKILSETPEKQDMIDCITRNEIPLILNQSNTYNRKDMEAKDFIFNNSEDSAIIKKVEEKSNFEFSEKEIAQGIIGAPDDAFKFSKNDYKLTAEEKEIAKQFHTFTDKYTTEKTDNLVFYSSKESVKNLNKEKYPNFYDNMKPYISQLKETRSDTPCIKWYNLWRWRDERFFSKGAKIIWTSRSVGKCFTYTEDDFYGSRNLFFIKTDRINLKYVTAFLNSSLCQFVMEKILKHNGQLLQIDKVQFVKIPLYKPTEAEAKPIVTLVDKILDAKKNNLDTSKLEKQVDEEIIKLYKITDKEKILLD